MASQNQVYDEKRKYLVKFGILDDFQDMVKLGISDGFTEPGFKVTTEKIKGVCIAFLAGGCRVFTSSFYV